MPLFSFEGFTTGAPVDLLATQGSDTVSGSVATWGQQAASTATIAIAQTETTMTQYDSVKFTASGWVDFDTPENHASSGDVYKPRYHDIVYFWDTGKSGNFSAPENLMEAHKSRRYAHGPVVMVCYDQPGVYTVRLYAYEPSSGKFAFTTTTVTVTSADSQYPGTQTICLVSNGGSSAAIPSGAQVHTLDPGNVFDNSHPAWTNNRGGSKKRFLFEGGATFDIQLIEDSSNITDDIMFGSFGTGRATCFRTSGSSFIFNNWSETTPKRCLINNLRFMGDFDPTTHTGNQGGVIGLGGGSHLVLHNVEVDAIGGTVFNLIGQNTTNCYYHFDEFVMTKMGGQYPILTDAFTHPDSSFAMTGSRVMRDPQSDYAQGLSGLGGQQRAPIRLNSHEWCYLQACDLYQNTGDQPTIKLGESGDISGGLFSVHCCTIESANAACVRFRFNKTSNNSTNLILRQNVLITGHNTTTYALLVQGQGCSIDSNLAICPGTAGQIPEETRGMIDFDGRDNTSLAGDSPNKVRNNTAVLYKSGTENIGSNFDVGINRSSVMDVRDSANVVHEIGFGNIPHAPLADGPAGILFISRNTGRYRDGSFNTGYATEPAEIYTFRPEPGSSALGARTTEDFFPFPIDAQTEADLRPDGSEDIGCWQGAS